MGTIGHLAETYSQYATSIIVIILLVILDSRNVFVTGNVLNDAHAAPENQNLDPNNVSPGALYLPAHYKKYKAPLPARVEPWDPTDDEINVHEYYYRNNSEYFLWHKPPCQWYNEGSDSRKNYGRLVGCDHILDRLFSAQIGEQIKGAPPSTKCANVVASRCFRFHGYRGRCYMMVQTGFQPNPLAFKYVLVNDCD